MTCLVKACMWKRLHFWFKLSEAKHHVDIKVDMDEMDVTGAEKKATYQQIKDYVLDKFGLKVSSLNIAQIKDKCGIKERKKYNTAKSESSAERKCTPEKEKAILDAFRYFAMI